MPLPRITIFIVSALIFVATEFFFPIQAGDALALNQKHFWAFIFLLFSIVCGTLINNSFDQSQKLDTVASVFRQLGDVEVERRFQDIYVQYNLQLKHTSATEDHWAYHTLDWLENEFESGWIPAPREQVASEMTELYDNARDRIVATNVGSTKYYFSDDSYIQANQRATKRQVPIVRFYLFSARKPIELRHSIEPKTVTFAQFANEVKDLSGTLLTPYSVLINLDKIPTDQLPPHGVEGGRDLLLVDNKLVAETVLGARWEAQYAHVSHSSANLNDAWKYFSALKNLSACPEFNEHSSPDDDKCASFTMSDQLIKTYFHNYEKAEGDAFGMKMFEETVRKPAP